MLDNVSRSGLTQLGRWAVVMFIVIGGWTELGSAFSCNVSPDCGGGVCINGQCEPCTEDPGLCGEYETYSNYEDPFCDGQSGDCWECSDCLPEGCQPGNNSCGSCAAGEGGMCPTLGTWYCDVDDCPGEGVGWCYLLFCPDI